MKRGLVKILAAIILLGGVSTITASDLTTASNIQVVRATTEDKDSQAISYDVYKSGTDELDLNGGYFTKSANVSQNTDGTYKVTLTIQVPKLKTFDVSSIDGQTPVVSSDYDDGGRTYRDISFNVNSLDALNNRIAGTVESKTKVLDIEMTKSNVDFSFDTATASGGTRDRSTLLDNLKSITNMTKDATGATASTTTPVTSDDTDSSSSKDILIENPKTNTSTNISKTSDGQSVTYKVVKNDGTGSAASNFLTNTATITPNSDGTYNVVMTIAYNKKLGDSAVNVNMVNNKTVDPNNILKYTKGDNDYLKFSFNVDNLGDLSKLIPAQLSLNSPDFGLDSLLNFNLDFDGLSSLDLSKLVNSSDIPGMIDDLSDLSGDLKSIQSGNVTQVAKDKASDTAMTILPQTGNSDSGILVIIGVTVLLLWIILLRGTYLKN
ncbi:LPXTG cell wall anchor domain-containing protein [Companilactobacillus hulinensis]|uniref:LPXTG cell wall anchor domain-containing protein n=1 Tax=Companilactobacillus hulinensis TaxID=2486007 RepID=UPI000F7677F2|nr:LPXTG cell wall anchor domain-containing protein [Companilactobacillus hulinensis]